MECRGRTETIVSISRGFGSEERVWKVRKDGDANIGIGRGKALYRAGEEEVLES
jgi:hypothetical protein